MSCPNCGSINVDMFNKQTDGQGYYEVESYVCNDCEWECRMEKIITAKGKENV